MPIKSLLKTHKAHDLGSQPRTEDVLIEKDVDFASLYLPQELLKGLEDCGFKKPSPVQLKALPLARCGLDLIIQAKSGTGKTLTFSLVALEMVDVSVKAIQVLILTPTREIALQIAAVISSVGHHIKGLKVSNFIGGLPIELDRENLKNCHIAVGAPGRIRHLIELNMLYTKAIKLIVLDEADKLMEDSFIEDIDTIYEEGPDTCQVLTSSATYTPDLISLLSQYMNQPKHLTPEGTAKVILHGVRQFVYQAPFSQDKLAQMLSKQQHLINLLTVLPFDQCIVFSNSHSRAQSVCNLLVKNGHSSVWLAGKLDQQVRIRALSDLKEHKARILVTTDLAARGIDASNVNLVVNLDVPMDQRTYLHRVGRAGRYGTYGMAITILASPFEESYFRRMLGRIGESHSVQVIQPGFRLNLWDVKEGALERLYGIPPSEEEESQEDEGEEDEEGGETKKVEKKQSKKRKKKTWTKKEEKFVIPKFEEVEDLEFPSMAELGDSLNSYSSDKPEDYPENFLKWVPVDPSEAAENVEEPEVLFHRDVDSSEDGLNFGDSAEIPPRYKKQPKEHKIRERMEVPEAKRRYFLGPELGSKKYFTMKSESGNDYGDMLSLNYPVGIDSSPEEYRKRHSLFFQQLEEAKKNAEEDEGFSDGKREGSSTKSRKKTQKKKKICCSNSDSDSETGGACSRNSYRYAMENWLGAWAAQCLTIQQYVKRTTHKHKK